MLTDAQLKAVMPTLAAARAALFLPPLNAAMHRFQVNTLSRAAAFVAQLAHESGELRFMEELWGPTPAQRRYEPVSSLAAQLGNTQPGDGKRFKGRGPIQVTGRANYKRYGGLLGIDLVADPARAAAPDVAFDIAGLFWATNHLNELADADQFVAITKRINGGTNGLADRQKYHERARRALAGGTFGDAPPLPRGIGEAPGVALARSLDELAPLMRGAEALRDGADDAGEAPSRRRPARKAAAKTAAAARKAPARKKAAAAGSAADGTPAKKAARKKPAAAKTAPPKEAAARKAARKKSAGDEAASRKAAAAKKTAPRATSARKPARGRAAAEEG